MSAPVTTNAYECIECSTITALPVQLITPADWPEDCPECGSDNVFYVFTEPCPDPTTCDSDVHHHGRGDHVNEVQS